MSEFVQSFARGLAVIKSFDHERRFQTVSDVARRTGLSRAAARRSLHTLRELGYAKESQGQFELTPTLLEIGYAFLASFGLPQLAQPILENYTATVGESSSVAILDDTDMLYLARVPTRRIMNVDIGIGTRVPAYRTSLGQVALAQLPTERIVDIFERSRHDSPTPNTIETIEVLLDRLSLVRSRGWGYVDQELEPGICALAVPVPWNNREDIVAMNVATHTASWTEAAMQQELLPPLLDAAQHLSEVLTQAATVRNA